MRAAILPDVPMDCYVRDTFPGDTPSLSSSIAHKLLTRSPLHAWTAHPRLNPAWEPDDDRAFDLGTAAHGVLLEGRELSVIEYPDYRSKHAQALRDLAKGAGQLPVLTHQAEAVNAMVRAARSKLVLSPDLEGIPHSSLLAEQTILWTEGAAYCRCRPDWLTRDHRLIVSFKTCTNAEPDAFTRHLLTMGYHTQAAFELAGVKAATGIDPAYIWIAVETDPPYACSLTSLTPAFRAFADSTLRRAARTWAECLARDEWPAFPDRICYLDPPPWAEAQFMERHGMEPAVQALVDDGRPLAEQMFGGAAQMFGGSAA